MGAVVLFQQLDRGRSDFPGEWIVAERARYGRRLREGRASMPVGREVWRRFLGLLKPDAMHWVGVALYPGMSRRRLYAAYRVVQSEFRMMGQRRPLSEHILRCRRVVERAVDPWVIRHLGRRPVGWQSLPLEDRLERLHGILRGRLRHPTGGRKLRHDDVTARVGRAKGNTRDIRQIIARAPSLVRAFECPEAADLMEQLAGLG